jgi:hypothetical protein
LNKKSLRIEAGSSEVFSTAGYGKADLGMSGMWQGQQQNAVVGVLLFTESMKFKSKGSSGRTTSNNLNEQLAMKDVKTGGLKGAKEIVSLSKMNDPRWPGKEGWVKYSKNVNGVEIHFNYNNITKIYDDFKFK